MTAPRAQTDNGAAQADAWRARAAQLAEWAWARFVNRTDVFGGYLPLARRGKHVNAQGVEENWLGPYTRPAKRHRGKVLLTPQVVTRHFAASRPEDVIGAAHDQHDEHFHLRGR